MANQLKMAQVQAILALYAQGWSARRIARELHFDRGAVRRHIRLAEAETASKPAIESPGSQAVLAGRWQGGDDSAIASPGSQGDHGANDGPHPSLFPAEPGGLEDAPPGAPGRGVGRGIATGEPCRGRGRRHIAGPWRAAIEAGLQQGLQARRIYQDLVTGHGYSGSYYSVRRLVAKLTATTAWPVRRMECAPGFEAQVDFGRGVPLVDAAGHRRGTWVFRIVLSHSRRGYSEAVLRQTTDDFLRSLENAFWTWGGVPQTLVIDNLKAAVRQADWFDPELCPKVRAFAEHYGLAVLPTRPYTPRHKGKIEAGLKYVKNNALKGRTFPTLVEQNEYLRQWEQTIADTRIHGTTRQQVLAVFRQVEQPALRALPDRRFALFQEALRHVHRDGHVQVNGAYYSVGPEHLGHRVWARWDGRLVRIFDERMQPPAVHAQVPPGRFSTQNLHLAAAKISGIERGTGWLLRQIAGIGPEAHQWAQATLKARGIEAVRVLLGLVSLSHRHAAADLEEACRTARQHGAYHLKSVRQLLAQRRSLARQGSFAFAQEHPLIRPLADYGQWLREALARSEPQNVFAGASAAVDAAYAAPAVLSQEKELV